MIEYVSGFGVGALISVLVQYFLNTYKDRSLRSFNEKKEAYIGIVDAYREVATASTNRNRKNYAYWKIRCELVASPPVVEAISVFTASSDEKSRKSAEKDMIQQMRVDLGVATNQKLF